MSATLAWSSISCESEPPAGTVVTISGSNFGAEGELLVGQIARFTEVRPDIRVEFRVTPDAADQRHQLYVQWLSARGRDPDILWLDVIWTPEFAGAGWILPLDRFGPDPGAFFPSVVEANSWQGRLYALPLFVDVGMLYWRTDLMRSPPATLDELARVARGAMTREGLPYGFVWQGARYE
ncbi:MAG: extracellular solute-binding protein, partial [Gemmatimonadota bacterium]